MKNTAFIVTVVSITIVAVSGCKTTATNANDLSVNRDALDISYTPLNLIGHSVERLVSRQQHWAETNADMGEVDEVRIGWPSVYGIDGENAIVYGNYYVTTDGRWGRAFPSIHGFIFKTTNGGRTWMQVLDIFELNVDVLTVVRFIDKKHGWIISYHSVESPSFGLLRTRDSGHTWQISSLIEYGSLSNWAFSSPDNGLAITYPFPDDISLGSGRRGYVGYWIKATKDGGRSWTVKETGVSYNQRDLTDESQASWLKAKEAIPEKWGIESSPRWVIRELEESYSVQHLGDDGKWENVFTLPMTPYRNEEVSR